MSDSCTTIVDLDVSLEEAPALASTVLDWLVAEAVVDCTITDSVLGKHGGHRPGRNFLSAVKSNVAPPTNLTAKDVVTILRLLGVEKAREALNGDVDIEAHLRLRTNGVEIVVGRSVFDTGGNGVELQCATCQARVHPSSPYYDAVDAWFHGRELASYACPLCHSESPIKYWRGPFAWAFGNLGIKFWNWPPLSETFIAALDRQLGHRTTTVYSRY